MGNGSSGTHSSEWLRLKALKVAIPGKVNKSVHSIRIRVHASRSSNSTKGNAKMEEENSKKLFFIFHLETHTFLIIDEIIYKVFSRHRILKSRSNFSTLSKIVLNR